MDAQPKSSIYTQDSKSNGSSIGIKKPGTTFDWRPAIRDGIDQFPERDLWNPSVSTPRMSYKSATMNSTLPLKPDSWNMTQTGSLAPQSNSKYSFNSMTILKHDQVAPKTLTRSIKLPPIGSGVGTAASDIGKLTEKMQNTTLSTKSRKGSDDGYTLWLPQIDGINMVLPSSSLETNHSSSSAATSTTDYQVKMTEEMLKTENYINSVLYGPRKTKRLPVFEEICPSSLFSDTENPN
ncbi:hypothetical protein ACET3Z_021987 [Daucus carota]